jgi:hypothetical protein
VRASGSACASGRIRALRTARHRHARGAGPALCEHAPAGDSCSAVVVELPRAGIPLRRRRALALKGFPTVPAYEVAYGRRMRQRLGRRVPGHRRAGAAHAGSTRPAGAGVILVMGEPGVARRTLEEFAERVWRRARWCCGPVLRGGAAGRLRKRSGFARTAEALARSRAEAAPLGRLVAVVRASAGYRSRGPGALRGARHARRGHSSRPRGIPTVLCSTTCTGRMRAP